MKNLIAGIALAITSPLAAAQGPYALFDIGKARWDADAGDVENNLGDGSLSGAVDDSATAYGIGAGYAFSDRLAVEVEYRDFGPAKYDGFSDGSGSTWCAGNFDVDLEATAIDASVVGRLPVGNRWALTARAGVSSWDADISLDTACGSASADDDGTDPVYGVGAEFDMNPRSTLVFNLRNNADVGDDFDVLTFTLGAQVHF